LEIKITEISIQDCWNVNMLDEFVIPWCRKQTKKHCL